MRPRVALSFEHDASTPVPSAVIAGEVVNVSNPNDTIKTDFPRNFRGFQLSGTANVLSALDGSYVFFGSAGFSGILTPPSNLDYTFYVYFTDATPVDFFIVFDPLSGEYAKSIRVIAARNVYDYKNSSPFFHLYIPDTRVTSLEITIANWSVPGHSYKVTRIQYTPNYVFNSSSIIDFTCSENLMDSSLSISPGICEQYADITLYDRYNYVHALALAGRLNTANSVSVEIIDGEVTYVLGTYVIADWDVENDDSVIKLHCRDKSYLFESTTVPGVNVAKRTLDYILSVLMNYSGAAWTYLDADTALRCSGITVPNNFWKAGSLKNLLNAACSLGMLRIYWYADTFYIGRCE